MTAYPALVAEKLPETSDATIILNLADRCDRCGAQAFVAVRLAAGELLFCGHHAARYELTLVSQGGVFVTDARSTINVKPSMSSA